MFLIAESLGGAVALHASLKDSKAFDGVILMAPMCGIDPSIIPHWLVVKAGEYVTLVVITTKCSCTAFVALLVHQCCVTSLTHQSD
jgi:alpha-beta hydrolase superfamily lysophospholipase